MQQSDQTSLFPSINSKQSVTKCDGLIERANNLRVIAVFFVGPLKLCKSMTGVTPYCAPLRPLLLWKQRAYQLLLERLSGSMTQRGQIA